MGRVWCQLFKYRREILRAIRPLTDTYRDSNSHTDAMHREVFTDAEAAPESSPASVKNSWPLGPDGRKVVVPWKTNRLPVAVIVARCASVQHRRSALTRIAIVATVGAPPELRQGAWVVLKQG
jgi:hypothetical protein